MISQTVEYALCAVVMLAQNYEKLCTVQRISELTQVPGPYLSKILQILVRAGLVRSQRGLHGGFVLVKQPEKLTVWDVVNAVEPLQRIPECPLGLSWHKNDLCPLHRRLDIAMSQLEAAFRATRIAELLVQQTSETPLCESASHSPALHATGEQVSDNQSASDRSDQRNVEA